MHTEETSRQTLCHLTKSIFVAGLPLCLSVLAHVFHAVKLLHETAASPTDPLSLPHDVGARSSSLVHCPVKQGEELSHGKDIKANDGC